MNGILSILQSIADVFNSLILFLRQSVYSLITLFTNIPRYLTFVTTSLNVLPTVILPFCLASISIYVIYLIVGRN